VIITLRAAVQGRLAALLAVLLAAASADAQPRKALADLGRLTPPPYEAPYLRAGDPWPVFDEAMRAYGRKQYAAAADLLRRAVTAEPDDPAANFFLSATLMMTDEVGEAEDRAGVVLAAGQTPFERAARYVLAKAAIRQGKLDAAERELTVLASGEDRFALEAAGLLPKVRSLRNRK
jgi:hypothetical protein